MSEAQITISEVINNFLDKAEEMIDQGVVDDAIYWVRTAYKFMRQVGVPIFAIEEQLDNPKCAHAKRLNSLCEKIVGQELIWV